MRLDSFLIRPAFFIALILAAFALALGITSARASTSKPSARKLQVVYRGDEQTGVWNVYVFGAECQGGRLTMHEPAGEDEPIRIECVEHR